MKAILETHTLASLKNLVRTHNIRGYSTMKKAELIRVMTSPQHYGKFAGTKTYVKPARKPRQPKPAPKPKGQQGRKPTKPPQPNRPPPAPKPIPPSYNDITKGKPKMPSRKPPTRKIKVKPRLKSSRPAPKAPSKAPSRQSSSDYDAEVREVKIDGIDYLYDSDNDEYYDYETHTQIPNPRKKKKTKKAATKDEGKAPKKSAFKDDPQALKDSSVDQYGIDDDEPKKKPKKKPSAAAIARAKTELAKTGLTRAQANKLSPTELFGMLPPEIRRMILDPKQTGIKVGNRMLLKDFDVKYEADDDYYETEEYIRDNIFDSSDYHMDWSDYLTKSENKFYKAVLGKSDLTEKQENKREKIQEKLREKVDNDASRTMNKLYKDFVKSVGKKETDTADGWSMRFFQYVDKAGYDINRGSNTAEYYKKKRSKK